MGIHTGGGCFRFFQICPTWHTFLHMFFALGTRAFFCLAVSSVQVLRISLFFVVCPSNAHFSPALGCRGLLFSTAVFVVPRVRWPAPLTPPCTPTAGTSPTTPTFRGPHTLAPKATRSVRQRRSARWLAVVAASFVPTSPTAAQSGAQVRWRPLREKVSCPTIVRACQARHFFSGLAQGESANASSHAFF